MCVCVNACVFLFVLVSVFICVLVKERGGRGKLMHLAMMFIRTGRINELVGGRKEVFYCGGAQAGSYTTNER